MGGWNNSLFEHPAGYSNRLLARLFIFVTRFLDVAGFTPSPSVASLRQERDRLRHHLVLAALLPVFGFPATLLQAPVDDDPVALAEILPTMLRLLAEHDNVDIADFFLLIVGLSVPPIDREPEIRHRGPVRRVSNFRILGQIADQDN